MPRIPKTLKGFRFANVAATPARLTTGGIHGMESQPKKG